MKIKTTYFLNYIYSTHVTKNFRVVRGLYFEIYVNIFTFLSRQNEGFHQSESAEEVLTDEVRSIWYIRRQLRVQWLVQVLSQGVQ